MIYPATKSRGFASRNHFSLAACVISLAWWLSLDEETNTSEVSPLLEEVKVHLFKLEITEPGEVESAENIEIKSEVRSRGSSSVNILKIVPKVRWSKRGFFG